MEDIEMKNDMKNEQAVSPVIATILMVAITVVLAGVLYVWANSLAADQPESGTRNSYTADDAAASTSANTDDVLMSVRWQHAEDDLNWAFVVMKLSVGDSNFDCNTAGDDDCTIGQDGNDDALWETGEFLTLSESGADIANGATTISLYVTYRGTAVAGDDSVSVS
jgi:flagellin-like protein